MPLPYSGWGRGGWSSGSWNSLSVGVSVTGVAGTVSVGSVTTTSGVTWLMTAQFSDSKCWVCNNDRCREYNSDRFSGYRQCWKRNCYWCW